MKRMPAAASPDAYVAALDGWRRACVTRLRSAVRAAADLDEVIKWGNLVYLAGGPVVVIRAEGTRVLLSFWRGQRLREIEPRLKPGGKYEMSSVTLTADTSIAPAIVRRLVAAAVALNETEGDPTRALAPRLTAPRRGRTPPRRGRRPRS